MTTFVTTNYPGFLLEWSGGNPLATFGGPAVNAVTCTTCHDQHSMTVYTNTKGSYSTMFFIRGQYTPNTEWQLRGAVLPQLPRWRVERNERLDECTDHLICFS